MYIWIASTQLPKNRAKCLLWKDFSLRISKADLAKRLHDISDYEMGRYDYEMGRYRLLSLHLHLWPCLCLINKIFLLRISGFYTFAISSSFPFYLRPLFQLSHNLGHSPDLSFCLDHWGFLAPSFSLSPDNLLS